MSNLSKSIKRPPILVLTLLAMGAFAGNSILCRLALKSTEIDAATFTTIRLISGALVLLLLVRIPSDRGDNHIKGDPFSALALFVYAACFSFAYLGLTAATGALILFGAVQATMIGFGIWRGERLSFGQFSGLLLALAGLIALLLPGLSAPPLFDSLLMTLSGIAWGIYSLRGRGAGDATLVTAGNFLYAIPITLILSLLTRPSLMLDTLGICYAIASGALASALGYAIWYAVLPSLKSTIAATVQLSVPILAALGGVLFLGESITTRLAVASIAVLGGIGLVVIGKRST